MIKLERARRDAGWSQRELSRRSQVDASYICNAEKRGLTLYPSQAARIAAALGWEGDPSELFEEVACDELAAS